MLEEVLDKEAGPKPKLVTPPASVGSASRHISQADLDAYINGQLSGPRLDFCRTHLDSCDECRAELEDMRTFKRGPAGLAHGGSLSRELDRRRRQKRIKAAATVASVTVVVAAVATAGWFELVKPRLHASAAGTQSGTASATVQAAHTVRPSATRLRETATPQPGGTAVASAQQAAIPPRDTAPVARAVVAKDNRAALTMQPAAQTANAVATPAFAQARGTARGTSQAPGSAGKSAGAGVAGAAVAGAPAASTTFALLGPFGDEISDDRPEFTWQPLPGAAKYSVILVDEGLRPIAHTRVKATSWRPRKPLRRGRTYLWQVTAILHNGTKVLATGPTSMEARIHIAPPSGKHSDK